MKNASLKTSLIIVKIFTVLSYINLIGGPIVFLLMAFGNGMLIEQGLWEKYGRAGSPMPNFHFNEITNVIISSVFIVLNVLHALITIHIMRILKNVLQSFKAKFIFNDSIYSNLKKFRSGLFLFFILSILLNILFNWAIKGKAQFTIPIDFMAILFVVVYVIIEIVKNGIKIQEEQDLTV